MKALRSFSIGSMAFLFFTACQPTSELQPEGEGETGRGSDENALTLAARHVTGPLAPLSWLLGDWSCTGAYVDLPPVSQAHPVSASFSIRSAVSGTWINGRYEEKKTVKNPTPVSLSDNLSVDESTPDGGIRAAVDSHLGRIIATFSGYQGNTIEYTGTYVISGQPLPFSETLVRINDETFTTDSRLSLGADPQSFQTLTCYKRH